ncbi:protein kinase domain-containing protein [Hyalangium rubrum]|uniref:Protein kinase n=1 Tax=Hyalangium rubrum TaxID=3103134 RepID=A0ABU5H448_9BACT|nr:protein kinase [Hyalangium sp. s54d21]MDY7228016.1 protein kinase [Hyalangium sp. s54d21]
MSGRQVGGRYVLEKKIAGGGMGAIWMATDSQLQRRVAIKLTTSQRLSSAAARRQFEQEAKAIAQFHHPNVVQIHDFGVDGDDPYIVMELLEGEDLETRLRRRERLAPSAVAALMTQVARALTDAHTAGIVHRDLKPANLFLARVAGREEVKILDFGLVRQKSRTEDLPTDPVADGMVGTLRYMSPEQIRGDTSLDHRSDLWSIAVVFFRALTGRFPFSLESVGSLLNGSFRPPEVAPSTLVPELGAELDPFFSRALDPDPAQRFQSANELAAAFSAIVQSARIETAKILVVDDEPDVETLMRQAFRRQLRDGLYEMIFASDGEDGLEKLRQNPDVDAILTDINMPRMDGLTFLGKVGEVNPLVKVIIVSAYSDMANIRTAMNRGAHDFLVKPLDFQDLEATLVKTLKHAAEVRQMVRSIEENALLRVAVQSSVRDRLRSLLQGPEALAGERVEATVAFVSIKDFTPVTRQAPPEAVIRKLNENFQVIVPELASRGGTVDKFLGESVMAVFRGPEHLTRALDACVAVRAQIRDMAFRTGDQSPYAHGVSIGLDAGDVVAGGLGGLELGRLDYTVVGDVVNTAAQLAALAAREQVLISERLRQRIAEEFECREAGAYLLGPGASVTVHDVLGRRGQVVITGDTTPSPQPREPTTQPQDSALAALTGR